MTVPMAVAGGVVHGKGSDARGTPLSISYVACCTAVSPLALSAVSFAISDIHFPYPKVHLETFCTNLSFSPPTPHTPWSHTSRGCSGTELGAVTRFHVPASREGWGGLTETTYPQSAYWVVLCELPQRRTPGPLTLGVIQSREPANGSAVFSV